MKTALATLLLAPILAPAGEVTILAGMTQYDKPSDGTYYNVNQPHDFDLKPAAYGVRWDSEQGWGGLSVAAQYTNFGAARTDAMAVSLDAPLAGGYIHGGSCVGPCAPLGRYVMKSEAQGIALTVSKYIGDFSIEWGANFYETKTSGFVEYAPGVSGTWRYNTQHYSGVSQMYGLAYRKGPWSLRAQLWLMDGPYRPENMSEAPAIFNASQTATLLAGYTF